MITHTHKQIQYRWLLPTPLILIAYALVTMPFNKLLKQLIVLCTTYYPGVHDYYATAGFAPTMLNAGLIGLMVLGLLKINKLSLNANSVSTLFIMMGFAFIGKNVVNVIPFLLGGLLYAYIQRIPFKRVVVAALLSSCLAPLVDFAMSALPYDFSAEYAVSLMLGVVVGLVAIPVSSHILVTHQGYNLYNMGYTAGFVGIIAISVLRAFGADIKKLSIVSDVGDANLAWLLMAIFGCLFIIGMTSRSELNKPYKQFSFYSGRLVTDFTRVMGPGATMMNMAVMGTIGLLFTLIFHVQLTGPIVAGILTLTGFASFGNHPSNTLPIMVGAMFGVLFVNHNLTVANGMIAVLFATTMAPIAGEYGLIAGFGVGVLHVMMVSSMADLHFGMNLYNNGFSGGLIATLIVPIFDAYKKEK